MRLFWVWFAVSIAGCCTLPETARVETRDVYITPPAIVETLMVFAEPDTANWTSTQVVRGDTIVSVRYVDRERRVYVYVRPDSVLYRDTVLIAHTVEVQSTIWQRLQIAAVGALVTLIAVVVIVVMRR